MHSPVNIKTNPYKQDFPLLVAQPELAYLDSAATSQRPQVVLDAMQDFYTSMNANPLRGLYGLSTRATEAMESVRKIVANFIGAVNPKEVAFTKNASEALNVIANSLGRAVLQPGDEIVISIAEHHSNILPWRHIAKITGAKVVYLYVDKDGKLTDNELLSKISDTTKIVAITHVSNVLGTQNNVKKIAELAHKHGAYVVCDIAQSIPHLKVDVADLNVDLVAFSGHKVLSALGVGALWGKMDILNMMPPFLEGGEMIDYVTEDSVTYAEVPHKFEAGTQDAAAIYTLGKALQYLQTIGMDAVEAREKTLMNYLMERLKELEFIEIIGSKQAEDHYGVVSFNVRDIHPHDVSSLLDMKHVAIRAGRHCAEPLLRYMNIDSSCRASLAFYNDQKDINQLIDGLTYVWSVFHGTK